MYNFVFHMPAKVLFGPGKLQTLHEETLPGKKALIVTTNGTSVKKYGYLASLEKELDLAGVGHELFDQIRPNPTSDNVMDENGLRLCRGAWRRLRDGLREVHRPHDDEPRDDLGLQPVCQRR